MIDLTPHLPALQVVVPMLCAPLLILLRPPGLAWAAASAASVFSFLVAIRLTQIVLTGQVPVYEMGGWPAPFGIALRIDELSVILLLIITGSSTMALVSGRKSLEADLTDLQTPMFYSAWLLAVAGLSGIAITADAFNVFVFMEISSLASYVIIAGGSNRRALPAVFKYLVMGTVGATFYLIGIGLIYMMTGTLNVIDMEARLHDVADSRPILVAAGFITIGLALKAAVFPLHVWLPNAYTWAPHIVTAFLAACATKVALYVLLRFDFFVFQQNLANHDIQFAYFLMPLALLAILFASAVALYERNLKRLLAYSSVAQIGYITLGFSLVSVAGLTAGVVHLFNHALAKGALFLAVAGLATQATGLRLENLHGIGRKMPWTMAAFVVAGLSLIGVPGTAGFISKWYLLQAAIAEGVLGIVLIIVIVAGSLMAVAYIWRVVEVAYFKAAEEGGDLTVAEAPTLLLVCTWILALANIAFGLVPEIPVDLATSSAKQLIGGLL